MELWIGSADRNIGECLAPVRFPKCRSACRPRRRRTYQEARQKQAGGPRKRILKTSGVGSRRHGFRVRRCHRQSPCARTKSPDSVLHADQVAPRLRPIWAPPSCPASPIEGSPKSHIVVFATSFCLQSTKSLNSLERRKHLLWTKGPLSSHRFASLPIFTRRCTKL